MELAEIVEVFYSESNELLESMESHLLELEKDPNNSETLNALFRAIHTIKGTSGMFGFQKIVEFTHVVENLLDLMRDGKLAFVPELSELLLSSKDHIQYLVQNEPKGHGIAEEVLQAGDALLKKNHSFSRRKPTSPT